MRKDIVRDSYKVRKNNLRTHCMRKEKKHCKNARDYEYYYRKED